MPLTTLTAAKDLEQSYQPLLLAEITFLDGAVLRLSTHPLNAAEGGVQYGGNDYLGRLQDQSLDQVQALADNGIDLVPSVSLRISDPDGWVRTNYEDTAGRGFRGARIVLRLVMYDVAAGTFSSDSRLKFDGLAGRPSIDGAVLTIQATSRTGLQRQMLPLFPIQRRCPLINPATDAQRATADNPDSPYYECGETRDLMTAPPCAYTNETCTQPLRRANITWDPPASGRGREYTSGQWIDLKNVGNEAVEGDYVPMVYGMAWVEPPIPNTFGDGNYTRGEAIVCSGRIQDILRVKVNDTEISPTNTKARVDWSAANKDYRYTWLTVGSRDGFKNTDVPYSGSGDPYGSMVAIQWLVPRQVADSASKPRLRVLVKGAIIRKYVAIASAAASGGVITVTLTGENADINDGTTVTIQDCGLAAANGTWPAINRAWGPPGTFELQGSSASGSGSGGFAYYDLYTENPVWILLDMLIKVGWSYAKIDLASFCAAAAYCDGSVTYTDANGNSATRARASVGLVIRQRRSAAEIVRGLLQGFGGSLLPNNATGKLQLPVRQTLAGQQSAAVAGSNYNTPVASKTIAGVAANGYVAYRFSPAEILEGGSNEYTSLVLPARAAGDMPNRIQFPFQDRDYNYAESSISVVDAEDLPRLGGQEVGGSPAIAPLGITTYDQALQRARVLLAEALRGNTEGDTRGSVIAELETSVRAEHLRVGDLIVVHEPYRGLNEQVMRVTAIRPGSNYETVRITATFHADDWYTDAYGRAANPLGASRGAAAGDRPPLAWQAGQVAPVSGDPLLGATESVFAIQQNYATATDGTAIASIRVTGCLPVTQVSPTARPPIVPVQGTTSSSGGSLLGGRVYWMALAAVDANGLWSALSAPVRVDVPAGSSANTITIPSVSWPPGAAGCALFAGENPAALSYQAETSGTPANVTRAAALLSGSGAPPDQMTDHLEVEVRAEIPGPLVLTIASVGANALNFTGPTWSAGQWTGYDVSLLADASVPDVAPLNYRVTGNGAASLTVTPDPQAAGLGAGDVVVIRSKPSISGLMLTDTAWALTADELVGKTLHVIAGAGRGQRRRIAANTATGITVDSDWATPIDSTSRYVIEDATASIVAGAPIANASRAAMVDLDISAANSRGAVLGLTVVAVSADGRRSDLLLAPWRDVYIFGQEFDPAFVVVMATSDLTLSARTQTILIDTTGGAVTVTLPAAVAMVGRQITAKWIAGSGVAKLASADNIDGAAELTLTTARKGVVLEAGGSPPTFVLVASIDDAPPAPAAPTGITAGILAGATSGQYRPMAIIAPAAPLGGTVEHRFALAFYDAASGGTLELLVPDAGGITPGAADEWIGSEGQRDAAVSKWTAIGVWAQNAAGVRSDGGDLNNALWSSRVEITPGGDGAAEPTQPVDADVSAYLIAYGTDAVGKQIAHVGVTIVNIDASVDYVAVWHAIGDTAPTDLSAYKDIAAKSKASDGTCVIDELWFDRDISASQKHWLLVTGCTKTHTALPKSTSAKKSVTVTAVALCAAPTGESVTVVPAGGTFSQGSRFGAYQFACSMPSADLNFRQVMVQVRFCAAGWSTPGPWSMWGGFNASPFTQEPLAWKWPAGHEWKEWQFGSENHSGQINWSATIVQTHLDPAGTFDASAISLDPGSMGIVGGLLSAARPVLGGEIVNGGFEQGLIGWTISGDSSKVSVVTIDFATGASSLQIAAVTGEIRVRYLQVPCAAPQRWLFQSAMKRVAGAGEFATWVDWFDAAGALIGAERQPANLNIEGPASVGVWQTPESTPAANMSGAAPAGAVFAEINIFVRNTTGTVRVDSVVFRRQVDAPMLPDASIDLALKALDESLTKAKVALATLDDTRIASGGLAAHTVMANNFIGRSAVLANLVVLDAAMNSLAITKLTGVALSGKTLDLSLNSYTTVIDNSYDSIFGYYACLRIYSNSQQYLRTLIGARAIGGVDYLNRLSWVLQDEGGLMSLAIINKDNQSADIYMHGGTASIQAFIMSRYLNAMTAYKIGGLFGSTGITGTLPSGARPIVSGGIIVGYI